MLSPAEQAIGRAAGLPSRETDIARFAVLRDCTGHPGAGRPRSAESLSHFQPARLKFHAFNALGGGTVP